MEDDIKVRVRNAVEKYIAKQDAKLIPRTKKNLKPEKEVEKACVAWLKAHGLKRLENVRHLMQKKIIVKGNI